MISRIAAVHSVAPIISDPIYGPKTLNSQLVSGLLVTSGMMPSAPGAVILNLPAHSNITIIPMLQTRKGIFRSATNAAIFVRTLFACDASADVVSVIKGLLHVMIHRCQILKADLNRDFRFGLCLAHHMLLPPSTTTNLPPGRAQTRSAVFRPAGFRRLTNPACCCAIIFSDTAPTLLPQPQNLQPQSRC